jgi:hypothetical protein
MLLFDQEEIQMDLPFDELNVVEQIQQGLFKHFFKYIQEN